MGFEITTKRERELNRWEWVNVHARDTKPVSCAVANAVLQHVWGLLGVPGKPPLAELVPATSPDYIGGCTASVNATKFSVYRPHELTTTVVLHELAHLITDDPLDELERKPYAEREMHGRLFLANFVFLLDRFMGPAFNQFYLRGTMPASLSADLPWHATVWGVAKPGL